MVTSRARGAAPGPTARPKRPFDIDEAIARIRPAVQPFKKAALFELAEEGHKSVFEQLCACIISIRTRDPAQSTQRPEAQAKATAAP